MEHEPFTEGHLSVEVIAYQNGSVTVFFNPAKPVNPTAPRDIEKAHAWARAFNPN